MKRGKNKRNHHQNVVEGDAWTQLLIEYHKAILTAAWDFAIDLSCGHQAISESHTDRLR